MVDLSTIPALYKTRYSDQEVLDLTFKGRVLWAMFNKLSNFTGDAKKIPNIYSPPGGRSKTFATAKALMAQGISAEDFLITRVKDYQLVSIDGESIEAAEDNEGAFLDIFERHVESGLKNLGRNLNRDLYRDTGGSRGAVGTSGITTTTLTLANKKDVVAFEVGMTVVGGANKDGTSLHSGTAQITSIDRAGGKLHTGSNWTSQISSLTDADYLFASGDATKSLAGLDAWCPSTAPAATTFFGVDRTKDVERLGGVRADTFAASGKGNFKGAPLEEAILEICDIANTYGESEADVVLMHSLTMTEWLKGLSSKKEFENTMFGNVGFKSVPIVHAGGQASAFGDRDCQSDTVWALEMLALGFHSLGMAPRPLNIKGTTKGGVHFDPDADGIIMRLGWRGQVGCRGPSLLARGTIA